MKLKWAILIVVSGAAASDAHAGSTSATMGVGLTIVAECGVSNCAAAPRSTAPRRVRATVRGEKSPIYVTTRSATAASPEILTMTY